ncbi:hypothetical protein N2W54_002801 [Lotmaria passim]
MPASHVCILHSGNGFYTDALLGNALQCLHAVQCSVRAASPDFIPSIAVFLADPQGGARCIYSSAVPDRNHALDRVAATYPPLADANGAVFSLDDGAAEQHAERSTAFAQLFRLRSPLFLQQTVLQAVKAQNASAPTSTGVAHEGFASVTTSASPSTTPAASEADVWGSLAGALLASLCYLRAHHGCTAATAEAVDDTDGDADDGVRDAASDAIAHPYRNLGRILIFSDARAGAAPSYSAECALAMSVVAASKLGIVVSCFGDAVVQADTTENRLVALASSLGGFCAARFSLAHLGQLLDGESERIRSSDGSRSRQKRDRVTSQYVVGPTMLPRVRLPAATSNRTSPDFPAKKERKDGEAEGVTLACERASHLGWLCPSCMAIIYRSPRELPDSSSTATPETASRHELDSKSEQLQELKCPFCCAV